MNIIEETFEKTFSIKLKTPLCSRGKIKSDDLTINYILEKDLFNRMIMDLLIFNDEIFPPQHKRINANGEITDLDNFQFSIIYETENEGVIEKFKMNKYNQSIAHLILEKGLANRSEGWVQKYL